MPQIGEVDPDLMGAAGSKFEFDQGVAIVQLANPVDRECLLGEVVVTHRVFLTRGRVLSQWLFDAIGERTHLAVHHREVPFLRLSFLELTTQSPVGCV